MFKKYGEMDSAEEINEKAAELKEAGNVQELKAFARENGLDVEDVQDYLDGTIDELTTPTLAAMGKIEVESNELSIFGVFADWKAEILSICGEDQDFAGAVRKKGKSLTECFAKVLEEESEKRKEIDKKITKLIDSFPDRAAVSTMTKKDQIAAIRRYYEK